MLDFYKFDKAMSKRVNEFMSATIWGDVVRSKAKAEIKRCNGNIDAYTKQLLDQPNGSTRIESIQNKIIESKAELEVANRDLAEKLAEKANFEWTEYDVAFYKAYDKAKNDNELNDAILAWIENIGGVRIELSDTVNFNGEVHGFVKLIRDAISGEDKGNTRTRIQSNGAKYNKAKRTKSTVLYLMYGKVAEVMLEKGTLKAPKISKDVKEMYAPKKGGKSNV